MHMYEGRGTASVYEKMMQDVITNGVPNRPRGKPIRELQPVVVDIKDASNNKFLIIPNRGINFAFALAEVIWILAGRGDYEFIGFYNKGMKRYLDDTTGLIDMKEMTTAHDFHGSYGKRIRQYGYMEKSSIGNCDYDKFKYVEKNTAEWNQVFLTGYPVDQLQLAHDKLQEDLQTRQAVVMMWDVKKDNFFKAKDYPCNIALIFSQSHGCLNMSVIRRSNDIVWGWPYNLIQYTSIQEYMAGWLGLEVGGYTEFINNLHIYTEEYPELFTFFEDAISKHKSYTLDLSTEGAIRCNGVMNKSSMDRYLATFFKMEKEMRIKIKPDTHSVILELYIDRWISEMTAVCASYYWGDVFKFLLAYHLYKSKHYDFADGLISRTGVTFQLMAIETFTEMKDALIESNPLISIDPELHNQYRYLYKGEVCPTRPEKKNR